MHCSLLTKFPAPHRLAQMFSFVGPIPSAVGCQPTPATDMASLLNVLPRPGKHVGATVYDPADDFTDAVQETTFAHTDATTVLSRQISKLGIYPSL